MIGKIVWDWLSAKHQERQQDKAQHTGDCVRLVALENQFHQANLSLSQDIAGMKADLAYIKRKLYMNGSSK